jgi:hypothetical protein
MNIIGQVLDDEKSRKKHVGEIATSQDELRNNHSPVGIEVEEIGSVASLPFHETSSWIPQWQLS